MSSPSTKKRFLGLKTDPLILFVAAGFIVIFVAGTLAFGAGARNVYAAVSGSIMDNFTWLYIGGVSAIFVFLIVLFVSRYGNLKLGDDDDEPEYSTPVWFAMLFAAGLGATLMFWGAAEPIHHAYNPPRGDMDPMSQEAIVQAFEFTYYHFAAHMWVVFALPGLALGYFIYKRKLPERFSSVFAPLLKGHIYRWPGKLIDALAIIGTTFGIAVSVGLGVLQINAGMNILWGVPIASWVHLAIIMVITVAACISVATGLDKGIKILSNINIIMAIGLAVFVLAAGPTLTLINQSVESVGIYVSSLPELMFWVDSHNENPGFQATWTAFYWAWTICWGPFVGMFIARISRGRTVRGFIGGVLGLISIFVLVWFSIFGRAAIEMELDDPGVLTIPVVEEGRTEVALFSLLEQYPLYNIVGPLALLVIVIFFVTSMDSAGLVMDMFATGKENVAPTYYRVGWVVGIGAVTAAMVLIDPDNSIAAIQEVVLIVAFPFFIIEFIMMWALVKAMNEDAAAKRPVRTRKWDETFDADALEEGHSKPAPGYDEAGNPVPPPNWILQEDGTWALEGDIHVDGDLKVSGEVDDSWDGVDPQHKE
ncbi:BCCT family transporter [Corynebacterium lubricantis]|uniref:BCCT family transporter n=1 Tax=Corynebacterium lubricantis TaxID=541095 RepID=UPI00037B0E58|nr:BCCT family transporter [Corynebacterium lubricantis]